MEATHNTERIRQADTSKRRGAAGRRTMGPHVANGPSRHHPTARAAGPARLKPQYCLPTNHHAMVVPPPPTIDSRHPPVPMPVHLTPPPTAAPCSLGLPLTYPPRAGPNPPPTQ